MNLASLVSPSSDHLDGALAREAAVTGAHPKIDVRYVIFAVGIVPTPELAEAARTHARALKEALPPWHAGYDYYNFAETPGRGRGRAPACLLPTPARDQARVRPGPGDHLRPPGPPREVVT
jgi:hypothetical protein